MKRKFLLSLLLMLCLTSVWSQTREVTGRVISDSSQEALSGVTVSLRGGKANTFTNSEGRYTIAVPEKGNSVLVFSYVGFGQREVSVGNRPTVDVTLNAV